MLMVLPRKIKIALASAAKAVGAAVRKGLADVAEAMWLVATLGLWLYRGERHGPFRRKLLLLSRTRAVRSGAGRCRC
jgi:hypothetical protein